MTITQAIKVAADGSGALERPEYKNAAVLTAGTAKSITVPANTGTVIFSATAGADFYVKYNGTATVPSSDVTDGSAPDINPTIRTLLPGDTISVISSANCIVGAAFYK